MELVEEWAYLDDRDLRPFKGIQVCMTCQHFAYGVDEHCHTLLACTFRQALLSQGDHLVRRCDDWVYVSDLQS